MHFTFQKWPSGNVHLHILGCTLGCCTMQDVKRWAGFYIFAVWISYCATDVHSYLIEMHDGTIVVGVFFFQKGTIVILNTVFVLAVSWILKQVR